MMTLNLEFAWEGAGDGVETPRTVSLSEGFREVETVGETGPEKGMQRVGGFGISGDGASDSEEEFGVGERRGFVKI